MSKKKQRLVEITDLPQSSTGAPIPFVVSDEHTLLIFYYAQTYDPNWNGTYASAVGADSVKPVAAVRLKPYLAFQFGPPNDEAISGHPLYDLGLTPYSSHEVLNSDWTDEFRRRNEVHPFHSDGLYNDFRHFIFTFHDSTLEVIARGFEYELVEATSILQAASHALNEWRA